MLIQAQLQRVAMPTIRSVLVNSPKGDNLFPTPIQNDKTDIAFYPFYPSRGVVDRGSKLNIAGKIFNSIISGNEEIEMRWLNSEGPLSILPNGATTPDQLEFSRNPQIGEIIYGRTQSGEYSSIYTEKIIEKTDTSGENFTYTEREIQESRIIKTTSKFFFTEDERQHFSVSIDKNKVRLYFMSPELTNSNELWFIDTISVFLDQQHQYLYSEIRFMSLRERIKATGKLYDIVIKLGAVGDFIPLPKRGYARYLPPILDSDENPTYENTIDENGAVVNDEAGNPVPDLTKPIFKADIAYPLFDYEEGDQENLYYDGTDGRKVIKTTYLRGDPQYLGAGIIDPVDSFQLEVDSGAPLHSVLFWGRPVETQPFPSPARTEMIDDPDNEGEQIAGRVYESGEEYVIPSFLRVNRPKLLFHTDTAEIVRDEFISSYHIKLLTFTAQLQHEAWTTDWKSENQLELNRDKTRFSAPIFRVRTKNNQGTGRYQTSDFRVGSEASSEVSLFGKQRLANSKWSSFIENWSEAAENGQQSVNNQNITKPPVYETNSARQSRLWNNETNTNKITGNMRLSTLLNTNAILTLGEEFLGAGGVFTTSNRDYWSNIADTVGQVGGAVIGAVATVGGTTATAGAGAPVAAVGGKLVAVAAGAFLGKMLKNILFTWIPEKSFISERTWKESTAFTYIAPKEMMQLIWNKQPTGNKDRIPLQYFQSSSKDNLSGRVNAGSFKYLITGKLTDKISLTDSGTTTVYDTQSFDVGGSTLSRDDDGINLKQIDMKTNPIVGVPVGQDHKGYILDRFEIKVVGETNLTLKLFNKRKQLINRIGIKTTANYSGNIQQYATTQLLSDYGISETVFEDPALDFEEFVREEQPILAQPWIAIVQQAKNQLDALEEINLEIPDIANEGRRFYSAVAPATETWVLEDHGIVFRSNVLIASSNNWGLTKTIRLPSDIKLLLTTAYPEELNNDSTDKKLIEKLKLTYGFNIITIDDRYTYGFDYKGSFGGANTTDWSFNSDHREFIRDWRILKKDETLYDHPITFAIPRPNGELIDSNRFSPYGTTTNTSRKINLLGGYAVWPTGGSQIDIGTGFHWCAYQFQAYWGILFPAENDRKQWSLSFDGNNNLTFKMRVNSNSYTRLLDFRFQFVFGNATSGKRSGNLKLYNWLSETNVIFQPGNAINFKIRNKRFSAYITSAKLKKQ